MLHLDSQDRFAKCYMKPNSNDPKYFGRDLTVGIMESERRKSIMPQIIDLSKDYCERHNIKQPILEIKGSVSVNKANKDSDLDIAVVIDESHVFFYRQSEWYHYERTISNVIKGIDFKIHLLRIKKSVNNEAVSRLTKNMLNNT